MGINELADRLDKSQAWMDALHTQYKNGFGKYCLLPKEVAAMLRKLQAENEALKTFAKPIVAHGDDCIGNWDGCELQDLAVKAGLLIEVEKTEPCNLGKEEYMGCPCREYNYGEESWTCYQTAKFLLED